MPIQFQPLMSTTTEAVLGARLRLHGGMYAFGSDGAQMDGRLVLGGLMLGGQSNDQLVVNLPSELGGSFVLGGTMDGYTTVYGGVDGSFALRGGLFGTGMTVMEGGFSLSGRLMDTPLGNYVLMAADVDVTGYGGIQFAAAEDSLALGTGVAPTPTAVMEAAVLLSATRRGRFDGRIALSDTVALESTAAFVVRMLVDDGVVFGDLATATEQRIARAVSRLLASGTVNTYTEATVAVAEALTLGELAWALQLGQLTDTMLLADNGAGLARFMASVLDQLRLSDAATPDYTLTVVLADDVVLSTTPNGHVDLVAAIREAVGLCMTLSFDNGDYVAWSVNTSTKGATTYTNYPFNSFAQVGGTWYAAAADGLHRLGGPDDDGEAIKARVRLGLSSLGTRLLKRMADAFIGYTSDGTLLLRVITSDERTGEKVAAVYKLAERPALAKRENRFRIGRGLKSVDWDFELENMDGADFALDQIQFAPLVLSRRTRG